MAAMLIRIGEVRVRLSPDDFLTLLSGEEIVLQGDYNVSRGNHSTLHIMLTDMSPIEMLTLINKATAAIAEKTQRKVK